MSHRRRVRRRAGRYSAGNLWSVFPDKFDTYPEMLERAGYQTGHSGKAWGPGKTETPSRQLAGKRYNNFAAFLQARDKSKPFCYWLGTSDPHRPFKKGAGEASGMDLSKVEVPGFFPDSPEVRGDIADYYFEVQRFDALVGSAMAELEKIGELDNTIIAMTGDHGMPWPFAGRKRCGAIARLKRLSASAIWRRRFWKPPTSRSPTT